MLVGILRTDDLSPVSPSPIRHHVRKRSPLMSIIKTLEIPKDPNFRSKNKLKKKNFHKTKELQADFQQFARSLMF